MTLIIAKKETQQTRTQWIGIEEPPGGGGIILSIGDSNRPKEDRIVDRVLSAEASREVALAILKIVGHGTEGKDFRPVAEKITRDLFVSGQGHIAERLVLEIPNIPMDNAPGWCVSAVQERIVEHLMSELEPGRPVSPDWPRTTM